jgi:DNA-binding NtrC family response regulator
MNDRLAMRDACVAVIEDDPATREVLIMILIEADYQVAAWDGREDLISFISHIRPDLLIQDIRIGKGLSIWELLDHVDGTVPGPAPRVLLCSADTAFLRTHREELEARSCAIVEKPFDLDTFLKAVEDCLEPSHA